jgi:hypothetical protein
MEEAMSSQRERAAWTEYAEMRQRQQAQSTRKPRAEKKQRPMAEELEQALDNLDASIRAWRHTPRRSSS